uniref:Lipocalin-2 1 n=1 Tax=Amblyomma americanum TaxID=6943 RepID=A0A0C9S4U7_AMBAM
MSCFTMALFLALGATAFGQTNTPTLQNLKEAIETDQRIWVKYRSFQPDPLHTCTYVQSVKPTVATYEFEQHFKQGQTPMQTHLYGYVSNGEDNEPVLTIKNTTGSPGVAFTLRYWDSSVKCGILTFRNQKEGREECEMHVWNDYIQSQSRGLHLCEQELDYLCSGRKYGTYRPDCS